MQISPSCALGSSSFLRKPLKLDYPSVILPVIPTYPYDASHVSATTPTSLRAFDVLSIVHHILSSTSLFSFVLSFSPPSVCRYNGLRPPASSPMEIKFSFNVQYFDPRVEPKRHKPSRGEGSYCEPFQAYHDDSPPIDLVRDALMTSAIRVISSRSPSNYSHRDGVIVSRKPPFSPFLAR